MEALRARVAQLEAENAALAAAGEEAAALAEHYARAEARARRRARADAALERVLRAQLQIATAHSAPACACPAPDDRNPALLDALIAVVRAAAPRSADRVASATLAAVALHAAQEYLALAAKIALGDVAKVVLDAQRAVNRARGADNVTQRDVESFDALARQARCFASAIRDDASDDVLVLHCALLRSATKALGNSTKPTSTNTKVKRRARVTTLADELSALITAERTSTTQLLPESPTKSVREEPKSPLTTSVDAPNRVAELEKRLEDESVRAAVFEAKLAGVHRTEAIVEELRDQLSKRELEIAKAQAETERVRAEYAREQAEAAPKVAARAHAAARLHVADEHSRRVRALHARTAALLVADLEEPQKPSGMTRERTKACRRRLRAARRAAAHSQVVRLDPNTLLPVSRTDGANTAIGASA